MTFDEFRDILEMLFKIEQHEFPLFVNDPSEWNSFNANRVGYILDSDELVAFKLWQIIRDQIEIKEMEMKIEIGRITESIKTK